MACEAVNAKAESGEIPTHQSLPPAASHGLAIGVFGQ